MLSALAAVLVALLGLSAPVTHAADTFTHRPIVFVHGYDTSAGAWNGMIDYAKSYGYAADELYAFDYSHMTPGDQAIENISIELSNFISGKDLVGKSPDGKIDIIAHSMGGLVARHHLTHEISRARTAHLVTFGTPHHGTNTANWGCESGVKCDLQIYEMQAGSSFLNNLNKNETPGPTRYTTFRSNIGDELIANPGTFRTDLCDGVVFGVTETGEDAGNRAGRTSTLAGADNLVTPCFGHNDYYNDDWTREKALDAIADADGAHTPRAVRTTCGTLKESWGKDKWVGGYSQACVTATGARDAAKDVYGELRIRGCGYYFSFAAIWEYAGQDNKECKTIYDGDLLRNGSVAATAKSSKSENARTTEIRTAKVKADPGQTVSSGWEFDLHAYQNEEWDVKDAYAESGSLTVP
ncbi:alpha/beta fold hydrolase [Streptomyces sp. NPDC088341]|uniref:esterase/lipase family protein n=1 Tax=Streptomyces sp. NPDC088341 TaxID=3154870 RepID=UPI00341F1A87